MSDIKKTQSVWHGMKQRCYNSKNTNYHNYGGRGITVCNRWRYSFANFFSDMGLKPDGLTIDRIDVNGNYEPSNCRWATRAQQARNQRKCIYIEYEGRRQTAQEWAREKGMSSVTIRERIAKGFPVELLFSREKFINGRTGELSPVAIAVAAIDPDTKERLIFGSFRLAEKQGFFRQRIILSMEKRRTYNGLLWEYAA